MVGDDLEGKCNGDSGEQRKIQLETEDNGNQALKYSSLSKCSAKTLWKGYRLEGNKKFSQCNGVSYSHSFSFLHPFRIFRQSESLQTAVKASFHLIEASITSSLLKHCEIRVSFPVLVGCR